MYRVVCVAAVLAAVVPVRDVAWAKSPGQTICYNGICHRVATLEETALARGRLDVVKASFYDDPSVDRYNPRRETSSGELLDADAPDNAASPLWPDGTVLLVRVPETGEAAVVRINNAGPYHSDRLLDLSRALAGKLGLAERGIATVETVVLVAPTSEDAQYRRGRSYAQVAGPIGRFADMQLAAQAAAMAPVEIRASLTTGSIAALPQTKPVQAKLALVRRAVLPARDNPQGALWGQTAWARQFQSTAADSR